MYKAIIIFILFVTTITLSSCSKSETIQQPILKSEYEHPLKNNNTIMNITSPAFENESALPADYTCRGESKIPPLRFIDVPDNTRSLVLIIDDPDAPAGTWVHWIVFNIDPAVSEISQDNQPQANFGINDYNQLEYGAPCPPSGTHRYFFKLYALDTKLDLQNGASVNEIVTAMQGHVIEQTTLIGTVSK